jgi:hypothetical protein
MTDLKGGLLRVAHITALICLVAFFKVADSAHSQELWTLRGSFSWVLADDDFDPVDNLFGASLGLLRDVGTHFRVGGEMQWITGDEDSAALDWVSALAVFEYTFLGDYADSYDVYVNLALGGMYVDARDFSGGDDEDVAFAVRPAVGLDLFLTEHVALNLQAGYLASEVTIAGRELDAAGFEGKIGLTVIY